jgi:kynureninase
LSSTKDTNGNASEPGRDADAALLADLSRALLPHLGPEAFMTIEKARRESNRVKDIVVYAANALADSDAKKAFVEEAKRIVKSYRAAKKEGTVAKMHSPVTDELMARAEDALAPIIGPLAGTLVQRYAVATDNSREFFENLSAHLRSKDERLKFFDNVRTRNGLLKTKK